AWPCCRHAITPATPAPPASTTPSAAQSARLRSRAGRGDSSGSICGSTICPIALGVLRGGGIDGTPCETGTSYDSDGAPGDSTGGGVCGGGAIGGTSAPLPDARGW